MNRQGFRIMNAIKDKELIQIPPLPRGLHPDHVKLIWSYLKRPESQRKDMLELIQKICDDAGREDFTDLIEYAKENELEEFYDGLSQIIVDCMIQSCHLAVCLHHALYVRHDSLEQFKDRSMEEGVAGPFYPYLEAMAEWMENMYQVMGENSFH